MIEKVFGRPVLTRDGVTVARDTYFSKRDKNMGAQALLEASETTNRIAGDGTTATVALGYHLMVQGNEAIENGAHPMDIKKEILEDSYRLLDELSKLAKPTKKNQLRQVATVSAGDEEIGNRIADAIEYVGSEGGVITEKAFLEDIECEYVDGYYLQSGFQALQGGKKELYDPIVIVLNRRFSSASDIVDLFNRVGDIIELKQGSIPKFLIIGDVVEGAYQTVINTVNQGHIDAVVLNTPPEFGAMSKELIKDIATYTNCIPIDDQTNIKNLDIDYLGEVDRVVASKEEATLFVDYSDGMPENVKFRISEIEQELKETNADSIIEKLRDRIAKLKGKIAIFRIGGATDTEKEELEFRIEDAIRATRAAATHGVVPGGGSTLIWLSMHAKSDIFGRALASMFDQLLQNAGWSEGGMLRPVPEIQKGYGFNLKSDSKEYVDMVKEGILDPKLVVEQVIRNATSVAVNCLTTDTLIIFEDRPDKA